MVNQQILSHQSQVTSLALRCSHSFHRRGCSISQRGSKVRGLCHVEEAKTPKCGKLQKQTPVPGIALLKPARHRPCKIKGSDQTAIETAFPEGSTTSTAYIKSFYYNVSNFKKICCIEGSTLFYFLKLQTKILHPQLQQGHSGITSNSIYMPSDAKYFPNNA